MAPKLRKTPADPAFRTAVASALREYRDREEINNVDLAGRLGMSETTLSKYLNCKLEIGGAALARAFTELGISVAYRGKQISAKPACEQISFLFASPHSVEETPGEVSVTIQRKPPHQALATVHIKVAG